VRRLWMTVVLPLVLLAGALPAQASHFYSTRAEQALEALITTTSQCWLWVE